MDEAKIKSVMATVFETSADTINDETTMDTLEKWDSLRHLNFVLALEDEFDVCIPDEEVGDMTSYKLVKLVLSELAGNS